MHGETHACVPYDPLPTLFLMYPIDTQQLVSFLCSWPHSQTLGVMVDRGVVVLFSLATTLMTRCVYFFILCR